MSKKQQISLVARYNELFTRRIDNYAAVHGFATRDDMTEGELREMVDEVCASIAVDTKLSPDIAAALKGMIDKSMFKAERKQWTIIRKMGR